MARVRRGTELLLSPQSPPATGGLIVLTGLRLLAGLIWLYNVVWKVPPDFGERGRRDLYHFTHLAVEHPVFTPFSWVIEHAVLPYFTAFGWGVLHSRCRPARRVLQRRKRLPARRAGIAESDLQVIRFDTDIGKHGDTGRSELDAVDAVLAGEADVAAIGSSTWAAMGAAELMGESLTEVWRTDGYCHCMFTALDTLPAERYQPWLDRLLAMSWDDSEHRKILELEGLRRWVPPHLDGYKPLFEAVQEQGIDPRW